MKQKHFYIFLLCIAGVLLLGTRKFDFRPPQKFYLTPAANGEIYRTSLPAGAVPGDTIVIGSPTKRCKIVRIDGFNGDSVNRYVLTVEDSLQIGDGTKNYGLWINGAGVDILGRGLLYVSPSGTDTLSSGISMNGTNYWSVQDVSVYRCKAGIIQNPEQGGRRSHIIIRNINFYDMRTCVGSGCTGECIYLGSTALKQIGPHTIVKSGVTTSVNAWFDGLLIENVYAYGCDGDFIQVALARNTTIRNCHVVNYGRNNISSHKNAFLIGGSAQADVDSCSAVNGKGPYIQIFGHGLTRFSNCNFSDGAKGSASDDAVYINKTALDSGVLIQAEFNNVSFNGANRHGIRSNATASSVVLCNVSFTAIGSTLTFGPNFTTSTSCIVVPPPPPPPPPPVPVVPTPNKQMKIKPGKPVKLQTTGRTIKLKS